MSDWQSKTFQYDLPLLPKHSFKTTLLKTIFLAAFLWNLLFIIQKYIKKLRQRSAQMTNQDCFLHVSQNFFNNIVLLFKNQLVQAVRCIAWRRPSFLIQAQVAKQIFDFFLVFILFITIVLFIFSIITNFLWCSKSLLG